MYASSASGRVAVRRDGWGQACARHQKNGRRPATVRESGWDMVAMAIPPPKVRARSGDDTDKELRRRNLIQAVQWGPGAPCTRCAENAKVTDSDDPGEVEPDYRASMAAERTYLAYLRTGLALLVAGVAVVGALPHAGADVLRHVLGIGLIVLGAVAVGTARPRWLAIDRAMRRRQPLPRSPIVSTFGFILVVAAALAVAIVLAL
jgi:putative membrane protein